MVVVPQVSVKLNALTLSQVAELKRGDIIVADAEDTVVSGQILVDRKAMFSCELGKIDDRYSARVTGTIAGSVQSPTNDLQGSGR
jgi:flagellar motor switch protein FliM